MKSDENREKLRFSVAFQKSWDAHRPVARKPVSPMPWAVAAAAMLGLAASAVFMVRLSSQNQNLRSELASVRKESARAEDAPAVEFLLTPVDRSTAEQRLEIGAGVALIRLNLALGAAAGSTADIRVRTAAGSLLLEQRAVAARETGGVAYVPVWLPSAELPSGGYSISVLQGDGGEVDYAFRLIRHR